MIFNIWLNCNTYFTQIKYFIRLFYKNIFQVKSILKSHQKYNYNISQQKYILNKTLS